MGAFRNEPKEWERLDWSLFLNGFVHLFWRREVLEEAVRWLQDNGYAIRRMDASGWVSAEDFDDAISRALDFPDYYGRNLNALLDCLRDVGSYYYGADPDASGTAAVILGYDAFAARYRDLAQGVLDVFATAALESLLIGHRMLLLVQSNDPKLRFDDVGAQQVRWNPKEWLKRPAACDRPGPALISWNRAPLASVPPLL
ncbi:MAG: barstar family protein [Acidimicrobiales bacterium]